MKATQTYTAVVTVTVEYNSDGGTSEPSSDKVLNAAQEAVSVDLHTEDGENQPDDDSEITGVSINWDTLKPTAEITTRKERILFFGNPQNNDIKEVTVEVNDEQYNNGEHFDKAIARVKSEDFDPSYAIHVADELPILAAQLVSKYPDLFKLAVKVHSDLTKQAT